MEPFKVFLEVQCLREAVMWREEIWRHRCRLPVNRRRVTEGRVSSLVASWRFAHFPKAPDPEQLSQMDRKGGVGNSRAQRTDRGQSGLVTLALLVPAHCLGGFQLFTNDWGQWIFPAGLYLNVHGIKENENLGKFGCLEPPGNPSCYVLNKEVTQTLGYWIAVRGGGKIIIPLFFTVILKMCHSRPKKKGDSYMWKY